MKGGLKGLCRCLLLLKGRVVLRVSKEFYIYIMDYYLALKRNEIMPFAATWIQLEIITLNEVSQKEKGKYHMILLTCGI